MSEVTLENIRHALGKIIVATHNTEKNITVSDVFNNADQVVPGSLFCAIQGVKFDGHDYIAKAIANGASVIVGQKMSDTLPENVAFITVDDSYHAWGVLCALAAGEPAKKLRLHGITGTNGKTSTTMLLHHFLTAAGRRCGLLTTIFNDVCDGQRPEAKNTMADAKTLQGLFSELVKNGATDVVMECSSHGLSQYRAGDAVFSSAVFTNLTGDHLDYHKTMDAYFEAKVKLFKQGRGGVAIVNADDEYGAKLAQMYPAETLSLNDPENDFFVRNIQLEAGRSEFDFVTRKYGTLHIVTPLTGRHNVYNTACALTVALGQGVPPEFLVKAAETAPAAPGRMEAIPLSNGARAFVDYAHTDDAIFRVTGALNALKKPGARLVTVFGCGGDRDRTKRPRMGKVAAENSDMIVVTSDNPRTEDPEAIIRDILPGVPAGTVCHVIADRAEAIRFAVTQAQPDDLVLIAGKGHETYQEINGIRTRFDDREQVRKFNA